jgi:hypothetical protein
VTIDRADEISFEIRRLLREAIETGVPFASERAREQARARVEEINDLLDHFLPV